MDVGRKSKQGNNDLIVCDNMTIDNGSSGIGTALAGAGLTAAALWWLGVLELPQPTASPSVAAPAAVAGADTDTDTQYKVIPTEGR